MSTLLTPAKFECPHISFLRALVALEVLQRECFTSYPIIPLESLCNIGHSGISPVACVTGEQ